MKSPLTRIVATIFLLSTLVRNFAAESPAQKPVFLYTRYFNAAGESRYLPDGTYKDVLDRMRGEFEVRVSNEPLTRENLQGVNFVLIANPSDKPAGANPPPHHVSSADVRLLSNFVEQGGGLMVLGNQENHNLEVKDINQLLGRFGLRMTNLYTDVKKLIIPKETPIIGGMRWAYYTGNLVLVTPGHPAKARALVLNDVEQKPLNGTRNQPGPLLAVAEPGRGHVVVATDAGWLSNDALSEKGIGGVAIKDEDNWEIFRRLAHWCADGTVPPSN